MVDSFFNLLAAIVGGIAVICLTKSMRRTFGPATPTVGDTVLRIDTRGCMAEQWYVEWLAKIVDHKDPLVVCEVVASPGGRYPVGQEVTAVNASLWHMGPRLWLEVL